MGELGQSCKQEKVMRCVHYVQTIPNINVALALILSALVAMVFCLIKANSVTIRQQMQDSPLVEIVFAIALALSSMTVAKITL